MFLRRFGFLSIICLLSVRALYREIEVDLVATNLKRNEIFARKGHNFKNSALTDYFKKYEWYSPGQTEAELTEDEKKQAQLLIEREEKSYEALSGALLSLFDRRGGAQFEYYTGAKKSELAKGPVRSHMDKATKDIPYRSPDLFVTGIRLQKRQDTVIFKKKIKQAIADELELVPYFKVQRSKSSDFVSLEECYADYINGEHCAIEYIVKGEKVLYVSHAVNQTTYDQHWHFVYHGEKLFLGRFYFRQMGKVTHDFRFYY